jgi:hypothetical protein
VGVVLCFCFDLVAEPACGLSKVIFLVSQYPSQCGVGTLAAKLFGSAI